MDVWKADEAVVATVRDLISKHHPHLAVVDDKIAVLFREKAAKAGGRVISGKSKKAASILKVLSPVDWEFIIELAADEWQDLNNYQRVALLDHHLCALQVGEDKKGNVKCSVRTPDVAFYKSEIERHGFWWHGGKAPEKTVIDDIFGL